MTYTCSCGASWGGLRTAHCAADGCHRTFGGITAFDAHKPGRCRDPQTCGMVVVRMSGATRIWGFPSTREWWKDRGEGDEDLHE